MTAADSQERERLEAALAGHYTVGRELGRGGMATVYLAQDLRHDRPVALKVLHPELASALGPERFQREIRFAARLQHPHILGVLDSGEAVGQLWFTMPYVEGESLRDRLNHEKQLPVDDAVRIAREAALALDYAHRHGVIHRDIKPENVLLSDGQALVADFGIARALSPGAPGEQLTATGLSVGTAAYMSPEQAAGEREVDARSDVYALGTVLYEMLAGETPFAAPTPQATIARRFTETPRPVRQLRESVPEGVERAVQKALARTAADRFATAADFARALAAEALAAPVTAAPPVAAPSAVAAALGSGPAAPTAAQHPFRVLARRPLFTMLVLGFVLGVGVLFAWRRSESAGARGDSAGVRRIAVLPFENLGDSADAYFADGVTDAVRGKLGDLPGVRVIARASSNQYRNTTKSPQQIGAELGVEYLLTATVRWQKGGPGGVGGASRVQVRPELIRVSDASSKWQEPFDAALTDVFQVQADIAGKVAGALDVALGDSAKRVIAAAPTASLAAYDAYLKGLAATQGGASVDPPSLRRSIAFLEQAVALDPAFALAWSRLAIAKANLYSNGTPTPELAKQVREAAERAEALAPGRAEGALALGVYYRVIAGDNSRALATFEAGLRSAPNEVRMLANAAGTEQALGRWEAALQYARQARAVDPRSAAAAQRLTGILFALRRYPEARAAADSALALAPTSLNIIEYRAMVALAQGDLADARAVMRAAPATLERAALLSYFGTYYDLVWVLDDAEQQELLALPPSAFDDDRGNWGIVRAQTYYLRGDQARARVYADSAQIAFGEQLRATPNDDQRHVFRGLALAYLGRKSEAIEEGERAAQLMPVSRDATIGAYDQWQLARIYIVVGEREKALAVIEGLLKVPYLLSPGWLRVDPNFAPLRGDPRFERLVKS